MAPLSDIERLAPASAGYRGRALIYDLGPFQLASFDMDPAAFNYTKKHMRQSGMEHWSLNFINKGSIGYASGNGLKAEAGEMYFHSYASPFSGTAQNLGMLHLMLNRDEFFDIADVLDKLVDRNLPGAMSPILRDFLSSISNHASGLGLAEIPAVNEAFAQLLRATVRSSGDTLEAARLPIAATQFALAKRIINENLKSPDLTPDMLCARMGISRRQLFYIFEKHGGVMKFISQRRLAACYNVLVTRTEKKLVSSIAYEYGFTNLPSFYRQFQERYGFSPGEARSARLDGHTPKRTNSGSFADWLLRTDGA